MKKIMIDPGHGGKDPGAVGNGLQEKDVALQLAQKTKWFLDEYYKNHETRLTRTSDTYPTLKQRTDTADNWGADIFVSIHLNAASAGTTGYEDMIYSRKYTSTARLQDIMHKHVSSVYVQNGIRNRGKKTRSDLHVLRETNMDAVLTENGFITNADDMSKMKQDWFRDSVARAHANGIAEFLGLKKRVIQSKPTVNVSGKNLYKVQIGAFKNRNNANNLLNKAKRAGFDAFIAVENNLYKVQIGAYSVKDNAAKQLNKAKAKGFTAFIA